jgi:hypothetical protein
LSRCLAIATLLAPAAVLLAPATALAVENGGTVVGQIALDEKRSEAPVRSTGFVPRTRNALRPPRLFDPTPHLVVVLEGGTVAPEDAEPPGLAVKLNIIGESFDTPVLPVVVGSVVEIQNQARNSPRLYCPTAEGLVPGDPINPKGERKTKKIDKPETAFEIRDRESAHLSGRIVAFPHKYFARVKPDGKFEITGVPPGSWKVKVWYADGYLETPVETVQVDAKRSTRPIKLAIPARLPIPAAAR